MLKIYLLLFCFIAYISIVAQNDNYLDFSLLGSNSSKKNDKLNDNYLPLVDSASLAICRKDTNLAIQFLQKYIDSPSQNILKEVAYFKIGELYIDLNKKNLAKKAFKELLLSKKRNEFYKNYDKTNACTSIIGGYNSGYQGGFRYNACLRLSDIAEEELNYEEALKYLKLAEEKYPAEINGCGNVYYAYKGQLNLKFAALYLLTKDTNKAIVKLWSCVLDREGYPRKAVELLREVLYSKFTNQQIISEIDKGIKTLRKVKFKNSSNEGIRTEINLFGYNIIWQLGYDNNINDLKERLQKDKCLNDIKNAHFKLPTNNSN